MLPLPRAVILLASTALSYAANPAASRWDGSFLVPGREMKLVVDLSQNDKGEWIGSAIFPTLDIAGAPLSDIAVKDSTLSFAVKGVLGDIKVRGNLTDGGGFSGALEQGGNSAPLAMQKTGPPQVDLPRQSTNVARELEGEWEGDMTAIDHNVHVRLSLANRTDGKATAKFFLKGRREVNLNVAILTQDSDLLTLEVPDAFLTYEGRFRGGEISGTWQQGPYEFALVLHRAAKP